MTVTAHRGLRSRAYTRHGWLNVALARYTLAPRVGTVPGGIPPVLLGVGLGIGLGHRLGIAELVLLILGSVCVSITTMGLNDLSDSSYDDTSDTAIRHISGGSRILQDGVADRGRLKGLIATTGCLALAVGGGLLLLGTSRLIVPIAATGFLLMIAYSYGLRLSERGWAQLAVLAGMGIVPVAAGYVTMSATLGWEPILVGVIPGALVAATVMACHEVDRDSDARIEKMTLPVRFPRSTRAGEIVFVLAGGSAVVLGVVLGVLPPVSLMALPVFLGLGVGFWRGEPARLVRVSSAVNMVLCVALSGVLVVARSGSGIQAVAFVLGGTTAALVWMLLEMWLYGSDREPDAAGRATSRQ